MATKSSKSSKGASTMDTTSLKELRGAKGASSMEELLANVGYIPKGLKRGETVTGTVVEYGAKALVLDIGAKSEGIVSDREFEAAKAYIKTLKPGDKVEAVVVTPEGEGGYTLLSLREAGEDFVWKVLEEKLQKGEEVAAAVESATRGGLTVNVMGIDGFVPSSHLGGDLSQNPAGAVGKNIIVRVIEIDRAKGRVVASEKAVSQAEFLQKQVEILEKIEKGEKFVGRVTKLLNFGMFVEVVKNEIPVEGLVHLSEIAWGRTVEPTELYAEGDEVEVVVIGSRDPSTSSGQGKLALSIKQLQEDPWAGAIGKYKKDDHVKGKVTKVGDFGAFVELEPGVEGLIHSTRLTAEARVISEGEEVNVVIEDVDEKNHKLSLGLVLTSVPVGYR